jgi:hypothetical protein
MPQTQHALRSDQEIVVAFEHSCFVLEKFFRENACF